MQPGQGLRLDLLPGNHVLGRAVIFRRAPQEDKYALHRAGPQGPYKIVAFSGVRGTSPRIVEDKEYATVEEAYHGLFMRRVHDLLES